MSTPPVGWADYSRDRHARGLSPGIEVALAAKMLFMHTASGGRPAPAARSAEVPVACAAASADGLASRCRAQAIRSRSRGRGARAVRIHGPAGRPRPALHAVAQRPGRHRRPSAGGIAPPRALPDRSQPRGRVTSAAGAGQGGRLRPGAAAARRDQDPSRRPDAHARQPPPAALGAGQGLRLAAVPEAVAAASSNVALVYFDIVSQKRNGARAAASQPPNSSGSSRSSARASCTGRGRNWRTAKRRDAATAGAAVPACRVSRRPAAAGGGGLQGRAQGPLPDGAGAHRHRQDHRHAVPAAQGLPDGQLDKVFFLTAKTPGRKLALDALRAAVAQQQHPSLPPARAGTGRAGQGLRASRTRPATATPARWREASTTACRAARAARGAARAARPRCDQRGRARGRRWRTASARIT